eukprot:m.66265 g.66265  ORF g.66265 m.66265 type:complete len:211 (+) comp35374_c0_seq2:128-760(+)
MAENKAGFETISHTRKSTSEQTIQSLKRLVYGCVMIAAFSLATVCIQQYLIIEMKQELNALAERGSSDGGDSILSRKTQQVHKIGNWLTLRDFSRDRRQGTGEMWRLQPNAPARKEKRGKEDQEDIKGYRDQTDTTDTTDAVVIKEKRVFLVIMVQKETGVLMDHQGTARAGKKQYRALRCRRKRQKTVNYNRLLTQSSSLEAVDSEKSS